MSDFSKKYLLHNHVSTNLLKVNDENSEVKTISIGLQTSKPDIDNFNVFNELNFAAACTKRQELLRLCVLLTTSRNTVAQENIMDVIRIKLGRIKDKDYKYIADLICLKDNETVDNLSNNLEGFSELHKKYS